MIVTVRSAEPTAGTETKKQGTGRTFANTAAAKQGLTLVPFSAKLERFLWDSGCE
jgi:hypothetical protein